MTPRRFRSALAFGALAIAPGCLLVPVPSNSGPSSHPRGSVRVETSVEAAVDWVYYPEVDVYYAPRHRRSWVLQGGAWVAPPTPPRLIGPSFLIEVRTPRPWVHHDQHVQRWGRRHDDRSGHGHSDGNHPDQGRSRRSQP